MSAVSGTYDARAIQTGASLARTYGAKLTIIHVIHDPFGIEGWNLPMPNLEKGLPDTSQENQG